MVAWNYKHFNGRGTYSADEEKEYLEDFSLARREMINSAVYDGFSRKISRGYKRIDPIEALEYGPLLDSPSSDGFSFGGYKLTPKSRIVHV